MDEKKMDIGDMIKAEIDELTKKLDNKEKKVQADKKEMIQLRKDIRNKKMSHNYFTGNLKKKKPKEEKKKPVQPGQPQQNLTK